MRANPAGPLFPTTVGQSRKLGTRPMTRIDGANLLKRRLKKIGMVGEYSNHSFRATGITRFLEEGGTLEAAQHMADHADSRNTTAAARRFCSRIWKGFDIEELSFPSGNLPLIKKGRINAVRRNATVVFAHGYGRDLRRLGHPIHPGVSGSQGRIRSVNLLHCSVWRLSLCFRLSRTVASDA